jgi:hypothetical protein
VSRLTSRLRQWPWVCSTLTLLLGITALIPVEPIRDAVDRAVVQDARLERSLAYSALGPISSMFDAMTLFTVGQIIGFTLWAFVMYAAWRLLRRDPATSVKREALYAIGAFAGLLLVYAATLVMPRPMAKLVVTRFDVIAADFHAHTRYSHDGRPGWSAADLRDWHTESGFHVAYITDHRTFDGVEEGLALDSALVGETSTTLLGGLEAFYHGEHVNILNAGVRYRGMTTADFVTVDDEALGMLSALPGNEPVLIETIPGDLSKIIAASGPRTPGVRGIEIVAGSPRGMSQVRRDHARILRMADSLNLTLVAGSDNHGWGRTAPGWTLIRIPGIWRSYSPDSMSRMIDRVFREAGRKGTLVVERVTADATPIHLAFTMPVVVWTVMRTLSTPERLAWLCWIWIPWIIVQLVQRRRTSTAGP